MARPIELTGRQQKDLPQAMLTDSLPDDYVLEAHQLTIDALQSGKSDDEIVNLLRDHFRRSHKELELELASAFLHKTKSRWQRYLSNYAPLSGKAGRPKALGMKAVLALASLMKASPRECGYAADAWTVASLLDGLRRWDGVNVSDHTLRRALHRIGYEWNGREFSRDSEKVTTGHQASIMRIPHRLSLSDCIDEKIVRAVLRRINEVPASPLQSNSDS
jgi:transposase